MTTRKPKAGKDQPEAVRVAKADPPMTGEQVKVLRELALDGLEPEAFSLALTQSEAAERIAVLKAKLKLMGHPPHTA